MNVNIERLPAVCDLGTSYFAGKLFTRYFKTNTNGQGGVSVWPCYLLRLTIPLKGSLIIKIPMTNGD